MPDETIDAFADHGVIHENAVETDLEKARQTLRDLENVGVDLDHVTWQLQNEGAQKFIDPYDALMKTRRQASAILRDERERANDGLGSCTIRRDLDLPGARQPTIWAPRVRARSISLDFRRRTGRGDSSSTGLAGEP